MRGRLRFGSADDLALTQLPQILRDFRQLYPQINLELTVNQSGVLARRLKAGQLDLVFVKQEPDQPDGRVVRRERLVWVAHKSLQLDAAAHVPLIVYQAPSLSRSAAIRALEDAGRTWRITCNVREINGVLAALRAGIGVAVFPQNLIPGDLRARDLAPSGCRCSGRSTSPCSSNPLAVREPVDALVSAIVARSSLGASAA